MTKEQIKAIRESYGETQEQFAQRVGVHARTVKRWEEGMKPHTIAERRLKELQCDTP